MSEAPLLNNEAARSPTGEILDQSQTAALEARRVELENQRLAKDPTSPTPSASTPPSDPTASPDPTDSPTSTTTEDGKTLLTAKDPKDGEAPKPEPGKGAPESYTAFTLPDGYTLSPEVLTEVTPVLRELNLDQTQAQKLVDFHVKQMIAQAGAPQATYEATRTQWQGEVNSDPEIKAYSAHGKSGLEAVKIDMGKAIANVLTPTEATAFKAAMDLTGAGDNPAFVRAFWKFSQHVAEGKPVSGAKPSPLGQLDPSKAAKPSAAQAMYPNLATASS